MSSTLSDPTHALDRMPARQPTDFALDRNSRSLVYLIHGATGTPVEMRYLALGLARYQWDVYVTTLPGHCRRLRDLMNFSETDWRRHIQAQLTYAQTHYDHIFLAGLSAGALLALDASLKIPVSGIGVLSPTFFYDGWNTPWHDFLLPLAMKLVPYRWQHLFFHLDGPPYGIKDKFLQEEVRAAYRPGEIFREWLDAWWPANRRGSSEAPSAASKGHPIFPLKTLTEIDRLINRVKKTLHQVTAPTLIIQAKEDDMTSPRNATFVYEGIHSQKKELILLDDCYHVVTIDKQKKEVIRHLHQFFKQTLHAVSGRGHIA